MINLELTCEQKKLVQITRELVNQDIRPKSLDFDQRGDTQFEWSMVNTLTEEKLICPIIPREYGGLEADYLTTALVLEEIAAGCAGLAAVIIANIHAVSPVIIAGSKQQKETFLPPQTSTTPVLASFAVTEAEAGSDLASISALAQQEEGEYVITGTKDFIFNASVANFFSVFANVNSSLNLSNIRAFIIPASSPGLTIGAVRNKVGLRYANTSEVIFKQVRIPKYNVIGGDRAGSGYLLLTQTLDRGRALVGASAVGLGRAAYEMAMDFAENRRQFGKPLLEHQSIAFTLAEMATKIELARLITWKACWLIDQNQDHTSASSMAKLVASQMAQEVTCMAADILGRNGCLAHNQADKLFRDARILSTVEGTSNIQKAIIAALL